MIRFGRPNFCPSGMILHGNWQIARRTSGTGPVSTSLRPLSSPQMSASIGEMVYGGLHVRLECAYTQSRFDFARDGFDEAEEVSAEECAELQADGSIVGEISYNDGDDTSFKAHP